MRSVRCGSCKGPKVHPSPTAYVYCDWCGVLMDWDFRLAAAAGERKLGPEFQNLFTEFVPRIAKLQRQQDLAGLQAVYRDIYLRHMEICPPAYSPRIADPEYRRRYADYSAAALVLSETDEQLKPLSKLTARAQQKMQEEWAQAGTGSKVPESVFMPFFKTWQAHQAVFKKRVDETGLADRFPDRIAPQIFERMSISALVQGWLPYLPDDLARRLMREFGLESEYLEIPDVAETDRCCAGCGKKLKVLEGAQRFVCEACGRMLQAEAFPCPSCRAELCMPQGAAQTACPFCKAVVTATRAAPPPTAGG